MIYDTLENSKRYDMIHPRVGKILRYLRSHDWSDFEDGTVQLEGDKIYFTISRYETKDPETARPEAHKKYIDVQVMLEGEECFGTGFTEEGMEPAEAHEDKDLYFYDAETLPIELRAGEFILVFPGELHTPGVSPASGKREVRKFVGKVYYD